MTQVSRPLPTAVASAAAPPAQTVPLAALVALVTGAAWFIGPTLDVAGWLAVAALALLLTLPLAPPMWSVALMALVFFVETGYLARRFDVYSIRLLPFMFFVVTGLLAHFRRRAMQWEPPAPPDRAVLPPLLAILAWQTLAAFWAPHGVWALNNTLLLYANVLTYVLIFSTVTTRRRLYALYGLLIVSALLSSGWIVASKWYELFWEQGLGEGWRLTLSIFAVLGATGEVERLGGLQGSNQGAGYLVFAGFLAMAFMVAARNRLARLALAAVGLYFLVLVILMASRGALWGGVFAVLFTIWVHPALRRRLVRNGVITAVVVIAAILIASPGFIDRILVGFGYTGELYFTQKKAKKASSDSDETGMRARMNWWGDGLDAMAEDWPTIFLGLGPGGFTHLTTAPEVHSLHLSFYYDMGLAGVFLYIWLVYALCKGFAHALARPPDPSRNDRREGLFLYAVLTGLVAQLAVHGLINYDLTSLPSRFMFLYLGVAMATLRVFRHESETTPLNTAR